MKDNKRNLFSEFRKNIKKFYKIEPLDLNLKHKMDINIKPKMHKSFNLGIILKLR